MLALVRWAVPVRAGDPSQTLAIQVLVGMLAYGSLAFLFHRRDARALWTDLRG